MCVFYKCSYLVLLIVQCFSQEFPNEFGLFRIPEHGFDENIPPQHLGFHPHHGHEGPVQHAGLPRRLAAVPVPLRDSDHELMFNITWLPSMGNPARDYSLEVHSETRTTDCDTPMCYEYNIPGSATWWLVPQQASPLAGGCSVRPGCAYSVRLTAHPWDGHTSANLHLRLDECVAGVCSCAHAPRLPTPQVQASTVTIQGEIFVNVTWALPPPTYPQRLPPGLAKRAYFISIGKQMVSDAHPAPWFAHTITKKIDAEGPVSSGEKTKWLLLPISTSVDRGDERSGRGVTIDVKLLARVSLIDERECMGPPGNATAYDPVKDRKSPVITYKNRNCHAVLVRHCTNNMILNYQKTSKLSWASLGGLCALAMVAAISLGTRSVKKVLTALRPAPVAAPLEPLRRRPAWLPLQLFDAEVPRGAQVERSPLYVDKDYEGKEGDEWEVGRSRVHLGALIGSGAFGRVHAAHLDMPGGETMVVAAKMLSENSSEEEIQDFLGEIAMLKHVGSHKHVIRLIGCCTQKVPLIALLEHAPRGDLLTLLRTARGRRRGLQGSDVTARHLQGSDVTASQLGDGRPSEADTEYTNLSDSDPSVVEGKLSTESSAHVSTRDHYVAEPALHLDSATMREFALQVALGMEHLEQRGITHRDLAARNILVDGVGTLKVADFGLSRSGIYVHTRSRPVPLRWLAPEAILHAQYCSKSDVWAFAVLLWEIATLGGFPYADLSNHQVPSFLAGGCRLPKPARASPRLYQLMVECWSEHPEDRPTFSSIVEKLQVQQLLYIDLDCVFPPSEEELAGFSDYDFSGSEA